jgi:hypothetical protein
MLARSAGITRQKGSSLPRGTEFAHMRCGEVNMGRAFILWLLGVPASVLLVLWLIGFFH